MLSDFNNNFFDSLILKSFKYSAGVIPMFLLNSLWK